MDKYSPLAEKHFLTFSRVYDELEDLMEFRLTYNGELMGSANSQPHVDHIHEIRRVFHKQLKRLWEIHPVLKQWNSPGSAQTFIDPTPNFEQSYAQYLGENFKTGKFHFVPLAIEARGVIVSMDILFLRSGVPGSITKSADLDGRLKTLIDALRRPDQLNQLGKFKDDSPTADEEPFFCLMEDDKLVGNVSITADTLLQPSNDGSYAHFETHDSRVVIAVSLKTYASNVFATVWS